MALLPSAEACALSARAAASKYLQGERTWIFRRCATVLMFLSIVSSTVDGASVTSR
ncbi:hypothetical protein AB0A81_39185 [Streptomyces flaveolus]|uniref:hypothetical protein n=1 Tax=Streptomyces flaveolus TaxID=67297 RepID=UPI0034039255